jgi:hypothetical protein
MVRNPAPTAAIKPKPTKILFGIRTTMLYAVGARASTKRPDNRRSTSIASRSPAQRLASAANAILGWQNVIEIEGDNSEEDD